MKYAFDNLVFSKFLGVKSYLLSLATALFLVAIVVDAANAASEAPQSGLSEPISKCLSLSNTSWSPQEQWVWNRLCETTTVDVRDYPLYKGNYDAKSWTSAQLRRSSFIRYVLISSILSDLHARGRL